MRHWIVRVAVVAMGVLAGCGGDHLDARADAAPWPEDAASDAGVPEDDAGAVELAIVSPVDGATLVRDDVVGTGEWAARTTIEVHASGVASIELVADGDFALGTITPPATTLGYDFHGDGARTITAIGRGADGAELARDEIEITIAPPADTSCHAMLDALGLEWETVGATPGVADLVRVQPHIGGVRYRYVGHDEPAPMLMDCGLAPRLARLSEIVAPYGIDEVIHIGIYNYRCIGGGDPDSGTCTPSQHAYARAIDLHAFGLADSDVEYSTETDFEITMRADACPIPSSSEADRVLKEIACELWAERVFQIVLTPNYNDAHRNHFHVDLTEGSMYLGESAAGIDPVAGGPAH